MEPQTDLFIAFLDKNERKSDNNPRHHIWVSKSSLIQSVYSESRIIGDVKFGMLKYFYLTIKNLLPNNVFIAQVSRADWKRRGNFVINELTAVFLENMSWLMRHLEVNKVFRYTR